MSSITLIIEQGPDTIPETVGIPCMRIRCALRISFIIGHAPDIPPITLLQEVSWESTEHRIDLLDMLNLIITTLVCTTPNVGHKYWPDGK